MARAALTTQDVDDEGLEATYTSANADGAICDGGDSVVLHVKNGSASDVDVTIQSAATVGGLAVTDRVVTVTASEERFIRLGPSRVYDRASGATDAGKVYVDYESVTTVTVAALGV